MSKVAIIIGFSYFKCEDQTNFSYSLPGVTLDLYLAYSYAISIQCDSIIVISDTDELLLDKNVLAMVVEGKVDVGIHNFNNMLKEENRYVRFTTMDSLIALMKTKARNCDRLLFYYSGHAKQGIAMIPKYRHSASYIKSIDLSVHNIGLITLLEDTIAETSKNCKVLCIMDCCGSNGLGLPYKLCIRVKDEKGYIQLSNKEKYSKVLSLMYRDDFEITGRYEMVNLTNWFRGRNITCISASSLVGKSYTSFTGSHFTSLVFSTLKNEDINSYITLNFILNYKLLDIEDFMPQVRCSHPDEYQIQPWIKYAGTDFIEYKKVLKLIRLTSPPGVVC